VTGTALQTLEGNLSGHTRAGGYSRLVNSVAFSPDGKEVVSGWCDKTGAAPRCCDGRAADALGPVGLSLLGSSLARQQYCMHPVYIK
jgi:WD40 repeat protein